MMRLIDADALLDGLEKLYRRRELNAAYNGYRGSTVTWNDAIFAIKSAPTASDWDRYSTKLWKEAYERGKRDAQPEVAKDTNVPSTDCISRQAAIDALRKEMPGGCSGKAEYIIEQLPTAQPELSQIARDIATIIENEQDMRVILAQPHWIPVTERLPENAQHLGAFCPRYLVQTDWGVTEGWFNPDRQLWYVLMWFLSEPIAAHNLAMERGDVPAVIKGVPVTAWMPLPKPWKGGEQDETD